MKILFHLRENHFKFKIVVNVIFTTTMDKDEETALKICNLLSDVDKSQTSFLSNDSVLFGFGLENDEARFIMGMRIISRLNQKLIFSAPSVAW